jgi:hypothetical protein
MSRQERRKELQLTRQLVEVKVVIAVRLPSHLLAYSTHWFLVESHLQTQRAAVKMLHDRISVLVNYVKDVLSGMSHFSPFPLNHTYLNLILGSAPKDHATIRSLVALLASLPASDSQGFRDEFETVPIR